VGSPTPEGQRAEVGEHVRSPLAEEQLEEGRRLLDYAPVEQGEVVVLVRYHVGQRLEPARLRVQLEHDARAAGVAGGAGHPGAVHGVVGVEDGEAEGRVGAAERPGGASEAGGSAEPKAIEAS
jgi:hypothetical protein